MHKLALARGASPNMPPMRLTSALLLFTVPLTLSLAAAQEEPHSPIAKTSNLSAALPPGEWSRVETAVDNGLAWLARQQQSDGRFPTVDAAQPAVTSLAVMAFLSRGHVPDHGPYGEQLSRAIDFVLSTQQRRGYFSLETVTPARQEHLSPAQTVHYNHAITGLMLGEVYGMTTGERSRRIEAAIAKALLYHREVQTRQKAAPSDVGGWRYAYPDNPRAASDLSVTGWALMFLRSARNAEFNIPKQHFDEGLDFVERCYEPDASLHEEGVFRYRPLESNPQENPRLTLANTASAMLTLMLGGRHAHEGVAAGTRWFRSREYPRQDRASYYYLATYYSSQALAQVGGDAWTEVFPQIARGLLSEQAADGSWQLRRGNEVAYGPAYSTSLAVLALTTAFQLLPIYQR